MLSFKSRQEAYSYCKDNLKKLSNLDELIIHIGEERENDKSSLEEILTGAIFQYSDVSTSISNLLKLGLKNGDKVAVILDELLMNGLKGDKEYQNLDQIEQIHLDSSNGLSFSIKEVRKSKNIELEVIDQRGILELKDIIHALSEEQVTPRLKGKFGAGFGLRVVSLHSIGLVFNITEGKKTCVTVSVPYRNSSYNNFQFIVRKKNVE